MKLLHLPQLKTKLEEASTKTQSVPASKTHMPNNVVKKPSSVPLGHFQLSHVLTLCIHAQLKDNTIFVSLPKGRLVRTNLFFFNPHFSLLSNSLGIT